MKSIIATTIIAASMFAGSAFAAPLQGFKGSSVDVNVSIHNGIATLSGHVESQLDRYQAEQAAAMLEGVAEVRNLITFAS